MGKQHQIRNHLMSPERLPVDRRQRTLATRVVLRPQEQLSAAGDVGQRIIDFVTGSVGQFFQRRPFLAVQRFVIRRVPIW